MLDYCGFRFQLLLLVLKVRVVLCHRPRVYPCSYILQRICLLDLNSATKQRLSSQNGRARRTSSNTSSWTTKVGTMLYSLCAYSVLFVGTVHGFAARPNLALPVVKDAFEKVTTQTAQWFKKTL